MRRVLAAVAAVGLLTACGGSKPGSGSSTVSAGTAVKGSSAATVTVKNFSFTPRDLTVAKGTKVTWKFEDSAKHNVTSNSDKFRSKDIQSGSYSYVFNTVGKYSYLCSLHQYMTGSIVVK
jgi:plastocyanin